MTAARFLRSAVLGAAAFAMTALPALADAFVAVGPLALSVTHRPWGYYHYPAPANYGYYGYHGPYYYAQPAFAAPSGYGYGYSGYGGPAPAPGCSTCGGGLYDPLNAPYTVPYGPYTAPGYGYYGASGAYWAQ